MIPQPLVQSRTCQYHCCRRGYLFNSRIFSGNGNGNFKFQLTTNVFTVTENKSDDYFQRNGNGNLIWKIISQKRKWQFSEHHSPNIFFLAGNLLITMVLLNGGPRRGASELGFTERKSRLNMGVKTHIDSEPLQNIDKNPLLARLSGDFLLSLQRAMCSCAWPAGWQSCGPSYRSWDMERGMAPTSSVETCLL